MTSRLRMISLLILVVSVALAGASVGFAATDNHMIQLNPTSGCPGTEITLAASLPFSGNNFLSQTVGVGTTAVNGIPIAIMSDPVGLMGIGQFEVGVQNGVLMVRGSFTVADVPCARPYSVIVALVEGDFTAGPNGGPQILDSVSAVFVVGGEGCPRLHACSPVGGVVMPTSKLEILAPYAALAGLLVAVSTVVVVKKRID